MTSAGSRSNLRVGKRDRGGGVPADGLGDDADAGELLADHGAVAALGDDGDVVRSEPELGVADDPVHRSLEQRRSPSSGRKGFGVSGRLRGHRRVPPPPAMITAYMRPPGQWARREVGTPRASRAMLSARGEWRLVMDG